MYSLLLEWWRIGSCATISHLINRSGLAFLCPCNSVLSLSPLILSRLVSSCHLPLIMFIAFYTAIYPKRLDSQRHCQSIDKCTSCSAPLFASVPESGDTRMWSISFETVIQMEDDQYASGWTIFGRIQLTFYATRRTHHDASCLVIGCDRFPAKSRCAPSRLRGDARPTVIWICSIQGHEYTPHPPYPSPAVLYACASLLVFFI